MWPIILEPSNMGDVYTPTPLWQNQAHAKPL